MTFQGGGFGEEARDEANQPTTGPIGRPWEEFAPPAYAQPGPNARHNPPPSGPAPPWTPPTPDYSPPVSMPSAYPGRADYRPPGHRVVPGYGAPPYPSPPLHYGPATPPGYGGGYGGPPRYPGPFDPYQPYRDRSQETNGLAIASLITSIAGFVLGLLLTFACFVGVLVIPVPIVGAVLGGVALNQIKQTGQPGRGLAIAGIAVGIIGAVLLVILIVVLFGAMSAVMHSPTTTPASAPSFT